MVRQARTGRSPGVEKKDLQRLSLDKPSGGATRPAGRTLLAALAAGAACVAVAALVWYFSTRSTEVKVASVARMYPSQLVSELEASGYVVAQRKADVAAKVTGRITEMLVREGSVVRQGDLIARLEGDDAKALFREALANLELSKARLEQARSEYENARLDFGRRKALVESGSISASEFDAVRARYEASSAALDAGRAEVLARQAALENARVAVAYTEIRAPFAGVVLTKNADVGDIVTPIGAAANAKAAVVTIADLDSLQVEADVSESNITLVGTGKPCDIEFDALPGERFAGVVDAVVPTVDRAKATVLVKVRFTGIDRRILPGMSAKVSFLPRDVRAEDRRARPMVDARSVKAIGGRHVVFVVEGGRAHLREVTLGRRLKDWVEIPSGPAPGSLVVVDPPEGLRDGSRVKIGAP